MDRTTDLDAELDQLRLSIDRVLLAFLSSQRDELATIHPHAPTLVDELVRVIHAGGRRFRPLLCYCGYRAGGGPHCDEILAAAASLELLHTFAILHDDVMDRSPVRRGEPSLFHRLAQQRSASRDIGDPMQFGISVSILAGDLAFLLSDAAFTTSGFEAEAVAAAMPVLHEMRIRAAAGQYLDLLFAGRPPEGAEGVRQIARLKTAAYSAEGPLLLGASLAHASDLIRASLARYGIALGEALQLRDDVLGMFGDPKLTGKDAHSDILQGKQTVLIAQALEHATPEQRSLILRIWGSPSATERQIRAVRKAVESAGALHTSLGLIEELRTEAKNALVAAIPQGPAAALHRMADAVCTVAETELVR